MKPTSPAPLPRREILHKPDPSLLYCVISYEKLESFVRSKELSEKAFGKVLMESKTLPRWEIHISEKGHTVVGSNSKILSFFKRIPRDTLPAWKKKCSQIREKIYSRDPTLRILPGYLSAHNIVFASYRDDFHKIYLNEGVYAEVIYKYENSKLRCLETAPGFFLHRDVQFFFAAQREAYLKSLRK